MGMTLGWPRQRMPLGSRSQGYVDFTAPKCGMMPSTKLGLSLLLCLGRQKMSITLKPSAPLPLVALRQTLL